VIAICCGALSRADAFRPAPNGELSVDKAIADLTALLADLPPGSPRALKHVEIIRRLRGQEDGSTPQPR
jgi:hypothetical protein